MNVLPANLPDRKTALDRKTRVANYHWAALAAVPLASILFQVYVPRFLTYLSYLDLPLLVTVYFALMYRSPIIGVFFGAGIGLAQDSLSHLPLGMFGIVKTLTGYFVATVSQRLEVGNTPVRFFLALIFFVFQRVLYWVLSRALLNENFPLEVSQTIVLAALNALIAVPLFRLLDKLRVVE
jgi:rod shape-determining protein MreD